MKDQLVKPGAFPRIKDLVVKPGAFPKMKGLLVKSGALNEGPVGKARSLP
jgi:hypothetical protein